MISFELEPLDTLFFRGSIPMEAGMQNVISMFPPPVSVLSGAFWTAACLKKTENQTMSNSERFGKADDMPKVIGFFLKKGNKLYAPAPATWYYDYDGKEKIKKGKDLKEIPLLCAGKLEEKIKELISPFQIETSAGEISFVKAEKEANPLNDCWVDLDFLERTEGKFLEDSVLMKADVYETENRTGIALDDKKHTIQGQLYTATHIRLLPDITMVVVFDNESKFQTLGDAGKILLGGEKRIVCYKRVDEKKINNLYEKSSSEKGLYLATVPVKAEKDVLGDLVASAKLVVTSGWNMAKGFHKPTVSWIPAGAVFNNTINNEIKQSCIPLENKKGEK